MKLNSSRKGIITNKVENVVHKRLKTILKYFVYIYENLNHEIITLPESFS